MRRLATPLVGESVAGGARLREVVGTAAAAAAGVVSTERPVVEGPCAVGRDDGRPRQVAGRRRHGGLEGRERRQRRVGGARETAQRGAGGRRGRPVGGRRRRRHDAPHRARAARRGCRRRRRRQPFNHVDVLLAAEPDRQRVAADERRGGRRRVPGEVLEQRRRLVTQASRQRVRLAGESLTLGRGGGPGDAGELTLGLGPGDVAVTQQRRRSARRDRHGPMTRLERQRSLRPASPTETVVVDSCTRRNPLVVRPFLLFAYLLAP